MVKCFSDTSYNAWLTDTSDLEENLGPPQSSFSLSSSFQTKSDSEIVPTDILEKITSCTCINQLVPAEFYLNLLTCPLTSSRKGKEGKKQKDPSLAAVRSGKIWVNSPVVRRLSFGRKFILQ